MPWKDGDMRVRIRNIPSKEDEEITTREVEVKLLEDVGFLDVEGNVNFKMVGDNYIELTFWEK